MRRHSSRSRQRGLAAAGDVIFGVNPVLEMLRASPEGVVAVYVVSSSEAGERVAAEARAHRVSVTDIDRVELDRLTGGGHHQGVGARVRPITLGTLEDVLQNPPTLIAILDGITDPQNLGAILRSAEVLGAGAVVVPQDRSVGVTPTVVRASSGATAHLSIVSVVNLARAMERIKGSGYWIVGLDGAGPMRFQDLPSLERAALVVGSEGRGIRPLVARSCDFLISIPVRGHVTSLNASAAAAIGLHELAMRVVRSPTP